MTRVAAIADLWATFVAPPPAFRPVPFWWWTGERLELTRLEWELDALRAQGVSCAVISYNHHANGQPDRGDPPVFSDDWWALLGAVLGLCEARGMTLGFQDYCLLKPRLAEVAMAQPELKGQELRHVAARARAGEPLTLSLPQSARALEVMAFRHVGGAPRRAGALDLTDQVVSGSLAWAPSTGDWTVVACFAQDGVYDPLHPMSGSAALASFFGEFERRLPGALGRILTVSFQDELDFGARFPLWSESLPSTFESLKGYSLTGRLAELFVDLDGQSSKFRLDFHDVSNVMAERGWFEPIYRWHENRGLLFGHDNAGRGGIEVGGAYYGDTMRAMRWYSAPGSDDPNLRGPRAFKGIKVASSIAHLYDRPRVWAECFHSSGWGISPSAMLTGLNALFALGATVINLHGLYYSTRGAWWEWAPPDFHFRQPYWAHMGTLNAYVTRLSWILAQGRHACDVAIFYPSEAVALGLNPRASPDLVGERSLSESQRNESTYTEDLAEALTFAGARALFAAGVDFDFIDSASLARSASDAGHLCVGRARYRVLVLLEATAMPWGALTRILAFSRSGGRVVIVGRAPLTSDRAGSDDPELIALITEIASLAIRLDRVDAGFDRQILPPHARTICVTGGPSNLLHRHLDGADLLFVHNPAHTHVELDLLLPRGFRRAECWNAQDGTARPLGVQDVSESCARIALPMDGGAACLIMLVPGEHREADSPDVPWHELLRLPEETWEFSLAPTMDNRFGDFQLPPTAAMIGPHAGRMWSWEPGEGEQPVAASDRVLNGKLMTVDWRDAKPGVAPRLRLIGPFPAGCDPVALDAAILSQDRLAEMPIAQGEIVYEWRDYAFSYETGIDDDPFLKSWDSGPHGLKGYIPDEFIDLLGKHPGELFYLVTGLWAPAETSVTLTASSRAAHSVWLDGEKLFEQAESMPPGVQSQWNLPHYDAVPRLKSVAVGPRPRHLMIRFVQPDGQRIRGYVAPYAPPVSTPRLRWFHSPDGTRFKPMSGPKAGATWFKMVAPPGLRAIELRHRGTARVWVGQLEARHERLADSGDDQRSRFWVDPPVRDSKILFVQIAHGDRTSAGDLITEPVEYHCGTGVIPLGDWTQYGLEAYSGMATYRMRFTLTPEAAASPLAVSMGDVATSCDVSLNGMKLGSLLESPWRLPLRGAPVAGENCLEITVANTLANFYAFRRPTPYASRDEIRSGLFGPVRILTQDAIKACVARQ